MSLSSLIPVSWKSYLEEEIEKPYFKKLEEFLVNEKKAGKIIYPADNTMFAALEKTPFENIKVVILGQDPYHGEHQAHGLSFSVPEGVKIPPSLKNIYKELSAEYPNFTRETGDLTLWAQQGVLLLNATLTVEAGKAGSHQKKGWEQFTNAIIKKISAQKKDVIFMLWGAYAQKKLVFIDAQKHSVLESSHPSPLSSYRGFFGCGHFLKVNKILHERGQKEVEWGEKD